MGLQILSTEIFPVAEGPKVANVCRTMRRVGEGKELNGWSQFDEQEGGESVLKRLGLAAPDRPGGI